MEGALPYNVITSIGVLVRVSHLVVDNLAAVLSTRGDWHDIGDSHISVRLRHGIHIAYVSQVARGVTHLIAC